MFSVAAVVKDEDYAPLILGTVSPNIISTLTVGNTPANAGSYGFTLLPPGRYRVIPVSRGFFFNPPSVGPLPIPSSLNAFNFRAVGTDTVPPIRHCHLATTA